jgi:hypothetical protein
MKTKIKLSAILIITMVIFQPLQGQELSQETLETAPYFFKKQFLEQTFQADHIKKKPGHYSKNDWAAAIDSAWGPGLPVASKLAIFDLFWKNIDWYFACFQDLIVDWESLKTIYWDEIKDTVSRGRFAAIMNHLAIALKESHTNCEDRDVCVYTASEPGIPLLWVGGWGNNGHFGAGVTPLPDSSLLVYKAIADHPLGLVPGDIVLGYDGLPWKILYQELLTAQLPVHGWYWGCSESSYLHSWLISAGLNWHLFDTIDIIKYNSGNIIHLPTTPLTKLDTLLLCTEQMEIPGVPMPDYNNQQLFSYGIIEGTQIAYIYGWGWFWEAENEFYNAIYDIMNNYETSGLIIDFRMNYGGNMFLSDPGLSLLFNTTDTTVGMAWRSDPDNHFSMVPFSGGPPSAYVIHGDTSTFYDKPIAVLTGPGAVSSGDQVALRMKFHPKARFFGKSTTTAFNAPIELNVGTAGWYCRYAKYDAYLVNDPENYLTHDEFEVDEQVWHNPDDVAQGIDAVEQTAVDWIDGLQNGINKPSEVYLKDGIKSYPNPFSNSTTIEFTLPDASFVNLEISDITGKTVVTLFTGYLKKGNHKINWNAGGLDGGVYFIRLKTKNDAKVHKVLIIK